MHVVQVSFFVDPEQRSPSKLLEDWRSLSDIAQAVASTGTRVTVIQASNSTETIEQSGVTFHFISPERKGAALTSSDAFRAKLGALCPDVYHVHGLGFAQEVLGLKRLAPGVPILLQDHADRLPRIWKRRSWRRGVAAADGVSFCARAQAEPFRQAGLLSPHVQVFEIPESTSSFTPGNVTAARQETRIDGDPAILWVGHLDSNKDPMTVLDGVSTVAQDLPNLKLWCCFASAPLLSQVQNRIARDDAIRDRVHLLGRVPHEKIEQYMRAADLFVLASHREGSSFSLIEALATGLTPVVTEIPSLKTLTGNGAVGALWPNGDSRALAEALKTTVANRRTETRSIVRAHFDMHLSSTALGKRFVTAYGQLASTKKFGNAISEDQLNGNRLEDVRR